MGLPRDEGWAIPFDAPFYPMLPAWYRGVQFQQVLFTADPSGMARYLPEPLEPSPDGACMAMGIRIPFSTAYGAFNEGMLQQKVRFRGQDAWYCSHVWHDGPRGIAAGREIYGTPKIFSEIEVRLSEGTMMTRCSMANVPVMTVSSTMETAIPAAALPAFTPSLRLKMIPRADGPGPALKQLIDGSSATMNLEILCAFRGHGTVHFEPSPLGDVVGLKPLTYGDAFYFEANYGEGFAQIALDYLSSGSSPTGG
jgi:acetoacetate decarboxylase